MKDGGSRPIQLSGTDTAVPAGSPSSGTPVAQPNTMMRPLPSSLAAAPSTVLRNRAVVKSGRSIPGMSSVRRRKGVALGQVPAQIPQATQRPGSTTASAANGNPSLLGPIVIAL